MGYALSLYQALTRINVPEADASAVVKSLEQTMATELATKADILLVKADISSVRIEMQRDIAELKLELKTDLMTLGNRIDLIETRLLIKLGALMTTLLGVFFFALRFS